MGHVKISIAGQAVEIKTVFPLTNLRWGIFKTDEPADFQVITTLDDIERERLALASDNDAGRMPEPRIEALALHREICEKMIDHDAFMIHGAAFALDDKGFLFCARSGTGKTTHLFHWMDNCSRTTVINGDKPFILFKDEPMICGSPWAGKEKMCSSGMARLNAIVLMTRSENNKMTQIPFSEAFIPLYQQIYRSADPERMGKTLRMLKALDGKVSFWRFQFNNFKDDCFDVAYNALVKGQT